MTEASASIQERRDVAGTVQHAHDLDDMVEGQVEHQDLAEADDGPDSQALESGIAELARTAEGRRVRAEVARFYAERS